MRFVMTHFRSCLLALCCAAAAAAAELIIAQDPITDCTNDLGRATLRWSGGSGTMQVRVGETGGPSLTGRVGPSGETTTGYWVTDNMHFTLINERGGIEARASAHLRCGGTVSASELVTRGGSFFPLQIGNSWVYRYSSRTVRSIYLTHTISRTETRGGLTYFVLTDGDAVVARLRADPDGRLWQFTGTAENPREELLLDPFAPATTHAPLTGPLGSFPDTVKEESVDSLPRRTRYYARGVGLVLSYAELFTGSSGGFLEGMELVEARIQGLQLVPSFPRLSLGLESTALDVSGNEVSNCAVPNYCVGPCSPDSPGAYKPCAQVRLEGAAAGAFACDLELTDAAGRVVYREPAFAATDELFRHVQLKLYSAANVPFPPGAYTLTARLKSGEEVLASESIALRIK